MKRKPVEFNFAQRMLKLRRAGIRGVSATRIPDETMEPLPMRISRILGIVEKNKSKSNHMIYFVMYDIESNKVRGLVAKYLLRKGFHRIQKSIFLADTERKVFGEVKDDLKKVQECYDNNDSILLVPVSTEQLNSMKIIGQKIDIDLILKNKNTLIF